MMELFFITAYFIFFHRTAIFSDAICFDEMLDCDFPTTRLCGEYWRKFKVPQDPYYFKHIAGARTGTYYPINILFSVIESLFSLDTAWKAYIANSLLHQLATCIFAYYLFGQGLLGVFGAIAWGFAAYHIKGTLWNVQTFTWLTATLYFLDIHNSIMAGVSLGLLILCGHPPIVLYFIYLLPVYFIFKGYYPLILIPVSLTIGLPQIVAFWKYKKLSVRNKHTFEDKVEMGMLPLWSYLFMFVPIKYRDYLGGVGPEEWNFYVGPVVGFFLWFGSGHCWWLIIPSVMLSTNRTVFKLFHKALLRFPHRWGYFAMLGIIVLAVDGVRQFNLPDKQFILLIILLAITMLHNRYLIELHPFSQWRKKPSEWFETPLMKFLEKNSVGYKINNLPFPVYTGQINHINTVGYTGGNHIASLGEFLKLPNNGFSPYNWFDFMPDSDEVDSFGIKYHFGKKPSDNPKWRAVPQFDNLWENINANIHL